MVLKVLSEIVHKILYQFVLKIVLKSWSTKFYQNLKLLAFLGNKDQCKNLSQNCLRDYPTCYINCPLKYPGVKATPKITYFFFLANFSQIDFSIRISFKLSNCPQNIVPEILSKIVHEIVSKIVTEIGRKLFRRLSPNMSLYTSNQL